MTTGKGRRPAPRIGVIGSASASEAGRKAARDAGRSVAAAGAILVCGGLGGVMEAAAGGAAQVGGPGMPEMLTPTDAIKGAGYKRVALLTDGRFSGATTGPCIGHIEMEAYNGGPLGAVREGDIIEIDIERRTLNVRLSDEEIRRRLQDVRPPERTLTPLLRSYRSAFAGVNCYGEHQANNEA